MGMSKYSGSRNRSSVHRSGRKPQFERLELRQLMAAEIFSDTFSSVWERLPSLPAEQTGSKSYLNVTQFTAWSIDQKELRNSLKDVPLEFTQEAMNNSFVFPLPTPEGSFSRFELYESPIMEPALAAQFPDIKTYRGQGIDDPAATLRVDVSHLGLRAQVLSPNGAYYIDPYWHLSDRAYVSYYKRDLAIHPEKALLNAGSDVVSFNDPPQSPISSPTSGSTTSGSSPNGSRGSGSGGGAGDRSGDTPILGRSGTQLRTYRLANAATGEFTQFHGGSVANGQAAIVTSINRVTGIYETELAVRLVLVANNSSLVYTDPATDPYSNDNGGALLGENQRNVDSVIGDANYDIGHVFGTGGGGLAGLGVVGVSGRKAQGQTGSPRPTGDAFDVDYVAHEIGHQFGGNHTFNGTNGACAGNRAASAAYEPGSGTTIMAYAGICGADDLQPNSDPYFHSRSFDEITIFTTTGVGNSAAVITNTGNNVPRISAGRDYVIPAATPFELDSVGRDVDPGTALTYQWEQRDLGPGQALSAADNGSSPLFRSWNPSGSTSRTFPRLAELLNNSTPRGEQLPTMNRTMNFRAVVRDNFGGGGGVNTDDMQITVVDTGAPFAVTSPNTAVNLAAQSSQTITWNVANTSNAPVNEAQVDIWLSVDGGLTFPILLASATANDGSEAVVLPDVSTTRGRIKVAARNSIFFDLSNVDFTISASSNSAPTISQIGNVWIPWNTSTPAIPFQIGDAETGASQLVVTAFALNSTLVPATRIDITGTDANRSIRVRPALREAGETRIYVGVTDEKGVTSFETFLIYVEANTSSLFGISVSDPVAAYREGDLPVQIASNAIVIDKVPGNYSTGSLSIEMLPAAGATDVLSIDFSAHPKLTSDPQNANVILFDGVRVATLNKLAPAKLQLTFNASTSLEAIESIINCIRFEATGEAPETFDRSVGLTLVKGTNRETTSIDVKVTAVNDRPIALKAQMDEIDEDAKNHKGTKVEALIDRGIVDPDGTRGKAIVVMGGNSTINGDWEYDLGNGWRKLSSLPLITASNGLVLGPNAGLRFVPAKDYFSGLTQPALRYFALDPEYAGLVSTSAAPAYLNPSSPAYVADDSPVSPQASEILQSVRAVNDPPIAVETLRIEILEDENLPEKNTFDLPSTLFRDVDDTQLTYRAFLRPGVPLPTSSWITFDPSTRKITLKPTNDQVGVQQFIVRATDPSEAFGDATVTVDVINVNDAPADIQIVGQPVPENSAGAFIGQLTAVDPDRGDSVVWSIVQNPSDIFEVRGDRVFLSPFSSFNFEVQNTWKLNVRATDNGTPPLFLEKEITVTVEDVNEFSPTLGMRSFSVSEAATGGAAVGRVVATDGDLANTIRYRFFGQAPSQFNIADDGLITVRPDANLDFETIPTYQFLVQAFDNGSPSLSTWASATVSITNANEFSPIITTDTLAISESFTTSPVARVIATDGDKQTVGFSLRSSETRFSIDENTGELRLLGDVLDYELRREEKLVVTVFDKGLSESRSSEKTITISVLDGNDPPSAVTLNTNKVPTNISGVPIGRIDINDPDGQTTYEVASLDNRFQVVAGNLQLRGDLFLRDSDPQIFTVPLLLNDVAAKVVYRMNVTVERVSNPTPWKNDTNPMDVNRDGGVDALDVLSVINMINSGISRLPVPRDGSSLATGYVDVDGDGQVTPLDVLAIVNIINAPNKRLSGEGEGSSALSPRVAIDNYFAQYGTELDPIISRSRRLARLRNS
jgi:hypothetical protein